MDFLVEVLDINCSYGGQRVVDGVTLRVRQGSLVCLLGPSGCGKTTALRAIAGFVPIEHGEICLWSQSVAKPGFSVPPERRRLGMVFQDYALFPHLNVLDNVAFGLRALPARERARASTEMLELVGLVNHARAFPHELSGGQQQRVALARALAPRPGLVLLDEPFSSLDVELRERLAYDVHDILKSQGTTGIMVTHDQLEAFAVGETVGVMHAGRLVQWDTPFNLYHEPADRFVADFIGQGRFIGATLIAPDTLTTDIGVIRGNRAFLWPIGTRLEVLLRPDDVVPDPHGNLSGIVTKKAFKGAETLYTLHVGDGLELLSLLPSHLDHAIGERVGIRIDAEHLVAFTAK